MTSTVLSLATPQGPGRCFVDPADDPTALLVLAHGAGGGTNAADLELLARRLPVLGITVVRFEQPWAVGRLFVGGRSAGARVACRTALAVEAVGVVCLAFPLHLPGRPDKSRAAELRGAGVPRLVLQGSKDTFGTPAEIREALGTEPDVRLVELPGADHDFRVAKTASFSAADLRARVLAEVGLFVGG